MGRELGSGNQYIKNLTVRTNQEMIDAFKALGDLKGTGYSKEIREALEAHLNNHKELLEAVRKDVVVNARIGKLFLQNRED